MLKCNIISKKKRINIYYDIKVILCSNLNSWHTHHHSTSVVYFLQKLWSSSSFCIWLSFFFEYTRRHLSHSEQLTIIPVFLQCCAEGEKGSFLRCSFGLFEYLTWPVLREEIRRWILMNINAFHQPLDKNINSWYCIIRGWV